MGGKRLGSEWDKYVRLAARVLAKLKLSETEEMAKLPDGTQRTYKDLDCPYAPYHQVSLFEIIFAYKDLYHGMGLKSDTYEESMEAISKCIANSLTVMDEFQNNEIGQGLYLGPSALDHDCRPNAEYVFVGRTVIVTSIIPTPTFKDCRISYIDSLYPREERQKWLKYQYFFDCKCKECLFEEPGSKMREELKHGAWRCSACQNSSPFSHKKCRVCGADGAKAISQSKKVLELLESLWKDQPDAVWDAFSLDYMQAASAWPYKQRDT